jgi:hypothetical protein
MTLYYDKVSRPALAHDIGPDIPRHIQALDTRPAPADPDIPEPVPRPVQTLNRQHDAVTQRLRAQRAVFDQLPLHIRVQRLYR